MSIFRRFKTDRRGAAAVEFLFVAPVALTMMAGVIDIGNVLVTKARLNAAVAAGVNYSIVHAADVSTSNATTMASSLARLVAASSQSSAVTASIVINNGPRATATGSGTPTAGGTDGQQNGNTSCYCPTNVNDWSGTRACGTTCTGGGTAGRFVRITASKSYSPLFSSYGLVQNGAVTTTNIVQTE